MTQKIISGEFNYCKRALKSWLAMGYKIVKARRWADGKYTYVLESTDRVFIATPDMMGL